MQKLYSKGYAKEVSAGKLSHILSERHTNIYIKEVESISKSKLYEYLLELYEISELEHDKTFVDKEKLKNLDGKSIHRLLGYENMNTTRCRPYEFYGKTYNIIGSPDKFYEDYSIVEELKTYKNSKNKIYQMVRGLFQLVLYSYIYDVTEGRLIILDLNRGIKEMFHFKFPSYSQYKTLNDGLSLYSAYSKV
uniref:YqaJ viral recombinase domain-containing protein n=1 Tax=Thermodesulfobacterium geofontis TaxID=1295609 RepID=A0A7C4JQG0_9BACT